MGRKDLNYREEIVSPADAEIVEPCISFTATLHQELPPQVVEVMQKHDLKIKLDKTNVSRMFDQMHGMVAKDGCISAPSGPGC